VVVRSNGGFVGTHARLQIANFEKGARIAGISLDEFLVLQDRLVVPFLVDEFGGGLENFVAIEGHGCLGFSRQPKNERARDARLGRTLEAVNETDCRASSVSAKVTMARPKG